MSWDWHIRSCSLHAHIFSLVMFLCWAELRCLISFHHSAQSGEMLYFHTKHMYAGLSKRDWLHFSGIFKCFQFKRNECLFDLFFMLFSFSCKEWTVTTQKQWRYYCHSQYGVWRTMVEHCIVFHLLGFSVHVYPIIFNNNQ